MYLVLAIGAMVFFAFGRDGLAWIMFLLSVGIWLLMFGIEVKLSENDKN
jgi:hypothetical protein